MVYWIQKKLGISKLVGICHCRIAIRYLHDKLDCLYVLFLDQMDRCGDREDDDTMSLSLGIKCKRDGGKGVA